MSLGASEKEVQVMRSTKATQSERSGQFATSGNASTR